MWLDSRERILKRTGFVELSCLCYTSKEQGENWFSLIFPVYLLNYNSGDANLVQQIV